MNGFSRFLIVVLLLLQTGVVLGQKANRPFPQHVHYCAGSIGLSQISPKVADDSVIAFYKRWKERYVNSDCAPGTKYIWFENPKRKMKCVSEGQGYGMIITVLMAGYDGDAKETFDALYRYYKAHPSKRSKYLMAWAQNRDCIDVDGSSATDGDMDIAYSLLLANAQWGSTGAINYLDAAKRMIDAIMEQEINRVTASVILSNSVEYDSKDYFDTRTSDFMPAHFKAFMQATRDTRWNGVIDNNYRLFAAMQQRYSPDAGLLPDFIQHINRKPKPAVPHYLESVYDGCYNYNACRMPWRVTTDYLLYADPRAKAIVNRIDNWLRQTTNDKPDNVSAGYTLAGNDIDHRYFEALSFIAPFTVAAMTEKKHQQWLNKMWNYLVKFDIDGFDYYDNSIKMLNMLIITHNYWAP